MLHWAQKLHWWRDACSCAGCNSAVVLEQEGKSGFLCIFLSWLTLKRPLQYFLSAVALLLYRRGLYCMLISLLWIWLWSSELCSRCISLYALIFFLCCSCGFFHCWGYQECDGVKISVTLNVKVAHKLLVSFFYFHVCVFVFVFLFSVFFNFFIPNYRAGHVS